MVENIFAQFDESNNKFGAFNLHFRGDDMSVANFAFNEKTTGKHYNSSIFILPINDLHL